MAPSSTPASSTAPMAPKFSSSIRSACRMIIWLEIVVNVANGVVSMIDPVTALQGMTTANMSATDALPAVEIYRWFGAISLVFGGYVLWRVLNTSALRPVLEGLLLGDVLYMGSLLPFTRQYGKFPLASAPYVLTVIMFIARIVYLLKEDWTSLVIQEGEAAKATVKATTSSSGATTAPTITAETASSSSSSKKKTNAAAPAPAPAAGHPPYFRTTDPLPTDLPEPIRPSLTDPNAPRPFTHPTAIIDNGATLGVGTRVWHFAHVCSTSVVGAHCNLGQNVYVANGVQIGNYCKIQNNVSVYEGVHIDDEVFLGPSCVFTNDKTPRAINYGDRWFLTETFLKRGVSIGANATIVCGVTLNEYVTVGSGATVTKSAPAHALLVGTPARQVGWVSRAGFKLDLPVSLATTGKKEATCPVSGEKYRLTGSILTKL